MVALRTWYGELRGLPGIRHSVNVTAETLYEAAAAGFGLLTRWERCTVHANAHGPKSYLTIVGAVAGAAPGASGSPILNTSGRAPALVSQGSDNRGPQFPQPVLATILPIWLVKDFGSRPSRGERRVAP